jgi:hypothetical protein
MSDETPDSLPPEGVEENPSARELVVFLLVVLFVLAFAALAVGARAAPPFDPLDDASAAAVEVGACPSDPFPLSLQQVAEQQARDAAEAARAPSDEPARALLETWRAANRAEAAAGDRESLSGRDAEVTARMAAFVETAGYDAWRRLGLVQVDALLQVVVRLEARGAVEGLDLPRYVARHPADADVVAFSELAGGLLSHAADTELFARDPDDATAEARRLFLLRVLVKVRWLMWLADLRPVETGLTRLEYQRFLLWKGRRIATDRPDEVMRRVDELRRLAPGAHWAWGFGCRALAAGRPELARTLFLAELAVHGDHAPSRAGLALIHPK